jgi:hypothetical protein
VDTVTDIRPGQTWAQQTRPGRTIRITAVADGKATCTNLTNTTEDQATLDQAHGQYHPGVPAPPGHWPGDKRGTTVKIATATLARKEWKLIQDNK